jgi:Purple acid Phosphatase, N-terminal domain
VVRPTSSSAGRTADPRPGPSRATITWATNVPADSQVQYGLTTGYGSTTTLDRTLVTSHSVTMTGLARKEQYFFQVLTRDSSGRLSSAAGSFRTR